MEQLNEAMNLSKCRKCKCMLDAFNNISSYYSENNQELPQNISEQFNKMEKIEYT
jgi:hypothetical protein